MPLRLLDLKASKSGYGPGDITHLTFADENNMGWGGREGTKFHTRNKAGSQNLDCSFMPNAQLTNIASVSALSPF